MMLTTKEIIDLIVILEQSGGMDSLLSKLRKELDDRRKTYVGGVNE